MGDAAAKARHRVDEPIGKDTGGLDVQVADLANDHGVMTSRISCVSTGVAIVGKKTGAPADSCDGARADEAAGDARRRRFDAIARDAVERLDTRPPPPPQPPFPDAPGRGSEPPRVDRQPPG